MSDSVHADARSIARPTVLYGFRIVSAMLSVLGARESRGRPCRHPTAQRLDLLFRTQRERCGQLQVIDIRAAVLVPTRHVALLQCRRLARSGFTTLRCGPGKANPRTAVRRGHDHTMACKASATIVFSSAVVLSSTSYL
jgi:hypothetical protein